MTMNTILLTLSRHCRAGCTTALLWVLILTPGSATAEKTRPQQIIDATRRFLEATVVDYLQQTGIQGHFELEVHNLDARLRLANCKTPLETRLESSTAPIGRLTVKVSCSGARPWNLYVPAQVQLFQPVLLTTRPVRRQEIATRDMLTLQEREVSRLPQGYLTRPEQAIGRKFTRSLRANQILAPVHLRPAEVIHKGDHVAILAQGAGLNVRMSGEALDEGALGEQIRVRNLSSGRTIRARVTAPGQVQVNM